MEGNKRAAFCENKMEAEVPRFVLLEGTIDDLIDEQENKNKSAKTDRSVSLLKTFLQRHEELRNVEEIPPAQLNELLSEFVLTVIFGSEPKMALISSPHYCEVRLPVLNDTSNGKTIKLVSSTI